MDIYYRLHQRKMNELSDSIDNTIVADKHEFTTDEINRLISFNQRLTNTYCGSWNLPYTLFLIKIASKILR